MFRIGFVIMNKRVVMNVTLCNSRRAMQTRNTIRRIKVVLCFSDPGEHCMLLFLCFVACSSIYAYTHPLL